MHPLTQTDKDKIAKRLVNRVGRAIADGELPADEIEDATGMIITAIQTMSTTLDVHHFFEKLASCWPFFREILSEETQAMDAANDIEEKFSSRNNNLSPV